MRRTDVGLPLAFVFSAPRWLMDGGDTSYYRMSLGTALRGKVRDAVCEVGASSEVGGLDRPRPLNFRHLNCAAARARSAERGSCLAHRRPRGKASSSLAEAACGCSLRVQQGGLRAGHRGHRLSTAGTAMQVAVCKGICLSAREPPSSFLARSAPLLLRFTPSWGVGLFGGALVEGGCELSHAREAAARETKGSQNEHVQDRQRTLKIS